MPRSAAISEVLDLVDIGLLLFGAAAWVLLLVWWTRAGRPHSFPSATWRPNRLASLHLLVCLALQIALPALLVPPFEAIGRALFGADEQTLRWIGLALTQIVLAAIFLDVLRSCCAGGLSGAGLRAERPARALLLGVAGVLLIIPPATALHAASLFLLEWLGRWLPLPPLQPHEAIVFLVEGKGSAIGVAAVLLSAGLLAPVSEELFFRGILQTGLGTATGSRAAGIIASSLLFGLVHFPQLDAMLPLCGMGIVLGLLYELTGLLWPCILAHALFNARTLLWLWLAGG